MASFRPPTAFVLQLHIIEVSPGTKPEGVAPFGKKQADIYFPPEAAQDFPVAMQVSAKYNMIYMVTKVRAPARTPYAPRLDVLMY